MACDCIKTINQQIGAEHNAVLVTTMLGEQKAVIQTEKVDTKKRVRPPVMLATYCPFCGTAYGAAQERTDGSDRAAGLSLLAEALSETLTAQAEFLNKAFDVTADLETKMAIAERVDAAAARARTLLSNLDQAAPQ